MAGHFHRLRAGTIHAVLPLSLAHNSDGGTLTESISRPGSVSPSREAAQIVAEHFKKLGDG